ncbi:NAD(P)-dependent oxidoreductase [Alphaproteobacteria bacterium]|jgi:3-hydroxyisobutyrate dehydrogenase-like beta-hydroxyacid dehydrogenase|nr:NAD(P)-dependent oxidoreductase [Alphaproteobacteria bacterium]
MTEPNMLGFVGVGVMGEKMCRNMAIKAGKPVLAFDQSKESLQRLSEHGVESANSLADVMARTDMVFLSLPGEPQVRAVVLGEGGLLENAKPGQIIVDCSTCPVALAQEIAEATKAKGVFFLDAPVSRGTKAAENGTLNFMVGGDQASFDAAKPYIETMGVDIILCGGPGAGQTVKLMNNMIVVQTVRAIAEALKVAQESGAVDGKVLFDTLTTGSADSFVLRNHGLNSMLPGTHPAKTFPVKYIKKDLGYALELAESCGVVMTGAETTMDLLNKAEAMEFGDRYYTIIIDALEKRG